MKFNFDFIVILMALFVFVTCDEIPKICFLDPPKSWGMCKINTFVNFYNPGDKRCDVMPLTGCGIIGSNIFSSHEECERICIAPTLKRISCADFPYFQTCVQDNSK